MIGSTVRNLMVKLGLGTKPDFIIVGAQKAGTTGLYHTLVQHSKICSRTKEVHYFDHDDLYKRGRISDYHKYFPLRYEVSKRSKIFEATPIYLYHPKVAERLYDYNSDIKLIVALRNPAERALSAWTMYHKHFITGRNKQYHDTRSFREAITQEMNDWTNYNFYNNRKGYLSRGVYYDQLSRLFKYFPKEQVLILESREIKAMKPATSKNLQSFIGVDFEQLDSIISNKARVDIKSQYINELSSLENFFQPYNEKLFELINSEFDWNETIKAAAL